MKKIMLQIASVLCIVTAGAGVLILDKSPIFAGGVILWSLYWQFRISKYKIVKYSGGFRVFTLIELLAVIVIVSLLMTILINIKTGVTKGDALKIHNVLLEANTESYTNKDTLVKVELPDLPRSTVTLPPDGDIYMLNGTPVTLDGSAYIGCWIRIDDKDSEENYTIKINTFTGKISWKYD